MMWTLGRRREFTLEASQQQQPTALGRAGNTLINIRKTGSTPANKSEVNVQGKEYPELAFIALGGNFLLPHNFRD